METTAMSNTERAIANDLAKIDLILAIGSKTSKAKARKHRKACFSEIKKMNAADGMDKMSADEILAGLTA